MAGWLGGWLAGWLAGLVFAKTKDQQGLINIKTKFSGYIIHYVKNDPNLHVSDQEPKTISNQTIS